MSAITIYLVDRTPNGDDWTSEIRRRVSSELRELFGRVASDARARPVNNARTRWGGRAGDVRATDLIVYFSPDRESGVARAITESSLRHSATGQTIHGDARGKISEVYIAGHVSLGGFGGLSTAQKAALFARGAFHECMHNKLHPLNIHTEGGGGLALGTLSYDYNLTPRNIELMAPALSAAVPQNTGFM